MTDKEYKKHTTDFFVGKKVRLLRELKNNGGQYAVEGTVCTVTGKFGGFILKVPPCSHGLGLYISRVEPGAVELLEDDDAKETN